MLLINEIKFVSIKDSKINKEKSNPKLDQYVFDNKVYFDKAGVIGPKPPFVLKWGRQTKDGMEISKWKLRYGFTEVLAEDGIWPEPLTRNAEGHYVNGDAILMKCSYENYIKKRKREVARSDAQFKSKIKEFTDKAKEDGADLDDEALGKMLGL